VLGTAPTRCSSRSRALLRCLTDYAGGETPAMLTPLRVHGACRLQHVMQASNSSLPSCPFRPPSFPAQISPPIAPKHVRPPHPRIVLYRLPYELHRTGRIMAPAARFTVLQLRHHSAAAQCPPYTKTHQAATRPPGPAPGQRAFSSTRRQSPRHAPQLHLRQHEIDV
jgi:hypothetical protein